MKKISTTETCPAKRRQSRAFTLIEMIGVLAVIAILASLLIPKVFSAINDARINNAIVSVDTIKTAVTDHYGKYNAFNSLGGTNTFNIPAAGYTGYDTNVLMVEGLLDKPFASKIGTNSTIQVVAAAASNGGLGYKLDGSTYCTNGMTYICEAVIQGVPAQDAFDLSTRIDGATLTAANNASADTIGRVEYGGTFPTTVYIYLTGR